MKLRGRGFAVSNGLMNDSTGESMAGGSAGLVASTVGELDHFGTGRYGVIYKAEVAVNEKLSSQLLGFSADYKYGPTATSPTT